MSVLSGYDSFRLRPYTDISYWDFRDSFRDIGAYRREFCLERIWTDTMVNPLVVI